MTKQTKDTLKRMAVLYAKSRRMGDDTPMQVFDEYRPLLQSVAQEFLPLVQQLVDAGVITIQIQETVLKEALADFDGKCEEVTFDAETAFLNGAIWISLGQPSSWTPADQPNRVHWRN